MEINSWGRWYCLVRSQSLRERTQAHKSAQPKAKRLWTNYNCSSARWCASVSRARPWDHTWSCWCTRGTPQVQFANIRKMVLCQGLPHCLRLCVDPCMARHATLHGINPVRCNKSFGSWCTRLKTSHLNQSLILQNSHTFHSIVTLHNLSFQPVVLDGHRR